MKDHDEVFGSVTIVVLLILTAWGNAIAMAITSIIGLIVGLLIYKKELLRGHALVATIGFVVAGIIAFVIGLSR